MDKVLLINYLPAARQDLFQIIEFISKDDVNTAYAFVDELDATISLLSTFPMMGIVPNERRLQSLKYSMIIIQNYLVFYVLIDDQIEIRRILHGKRKYQFLL